MMIICSHGADLSAADSRCDSGKTLSFPFSSHRAIPTRVTRGKRPQSRRLTASLFIIAKF
eukprot:1159864-Pelagomonas_calceolata.AAC.21